MLDGTQFPALSLPSLHIIEFSPGMNEKMRLCQNGRCAPTEAMMRPHDGAVSRSCPEQ